jgi:hypothetical protein
VAQKMYCKLVISPKLETDSMTHLLTTGLTHLRVYG